MGQIDLTLNNIETDEILCFIWKNSSCVCTVTTVLLQGVFPTHRAKLNQM